MPSLQQLNFKDGTHPDIDKTLTGSDILHRHSINSLLEQQELISRGLSSPSAEGETLTISDMLNLSNNTRTTSSLIGNQTTNSLSAALSNIPSSQSSLSPGIFMPQAKNYDAFQFDNIGLNSPLKMFQRNLSFDCSPSTPMSPSTPSPLYQSRPIRGSPYNRECNSPAAQDTNQIPALYGLSSRSNSPDSDNSAISNIDTNLIELMNYLALNQSQVRQLSSQPQCGGDTSGNQVLNGISQADLELAKLQNLQTLSALKLLQQPPSPLQMPMLNLNQLLQQCNTNQLKNWQQLQQQQQTNHQVQLQSSVTNTNDANLDRVARFHRSSAAMREATCTWSGVLPPRSHKIINYSSKVFLGGIPWDITEQSLLQIFKPFGQIKVEWPGKEQKASKPKGHVYIIFESEKQVRALLASCSIRDGDALNGGKYYCRISSRRIKTKEVEVKPWIIGDSNYVKSTSQKLDPTKTIFVGALHGKLTAEGLAVIMNDLFDGVVYAGIDTDKYKYPIGSGRVTFNNSRSYMKAVSAAFIEIKTSLFTKTVQVDPYLEDSLCSVCGVQQGPYYCREMSCFRYFCRSCWQWQHNNETMFRNHKPLSRNSKSQALVGIGPQANIQSENNTIQKLKTRMEYY